MRLSLEIQHQVPVFTARGLYKMDYVVVFERRTTCGKYKYLRKKFNPSSVIILLVLLCFAIWLVIYRFRRRRMYKMASAIPGFSRELPVIGLAHTLTGNTADILSTLQQYSYEAMQQDRVLRAWFGPLLYFVIQDPVDLEMILKTCMEKDDLHRFLQSIIGNGGIFAPVAIWRKRRKILVPAFSPKIVETFVEIFSEQSAKLATRLADCVGLGQVKMWPYVNTYTLDSVCESVMGIQIKAQDRPDTPFLKAMQILLNIAAERIFHLWLRSDWLFKFFPQYLEEKKYLKIMHDFTNEVISKKREEIQNLKKDRTSIDHFDLSSYKTQSFLDHLIRISGGENGLTNLELREEVLTLTIAGTDTSAVAIGYTLKLLAMYPKVQEKVYQELQDVFDDSDRLLVKEDLPKLKYLERVVKESLRLYPPVPFIIRKVLQDVILPSGTVLPAGSGAIVCIWGLHRDPKHWGPDAECFDPDRFLPERYKPTHSCSFVPFSSGPRNCLGYQYAMMSVKTALSAIVRKYKIVGISESGPIPKIKSKLDVMMKAIDDYEVILEKR